MRDARRQTFASCWHLNNNESAAMWKLYLADKPGVVVVSTFRRLADSFHSYTEAIFVGQIQHIDPKIETISEWKRGPNIYLPIMHKRKLFQSDQEVRVLLNPMSNTSLAARNNNTRGLLIPVDLNGLVVEVRANHSRR